MHLISGHDATVAIWVGQRLGGVFVPPYTGLGIVDGSGRLRGGFIVRAQNASTCELSLYSERVLTHGVMRAMWRTVFDDLGFSRCVIHTRRANKPLKRAAPKLGFRFEGVARNFYGPGVDALQFAMTPDTCRWIKAHGQPVQQAQGAQAD